MNRVHLKALLVKLVDRGLTPVIEKLSDDEYTITVEIKNGVGGAGITPADFQSILDLGIGVEITSAKFT